MDYASKKIIDIQVIDKQETELKSPNMEPKGFRRALSNLESKGLKVVEVITDAHPQIVAMLSECPIL